MQRSHGLTRCPGLEHVHLVSLFFLDTPCWLHWCLKNSRDFRLNLFDSYDNTVLRVMRQKKWAPPRMDDVNIFGPSDDLLGKVQQE